MIVNYDVVNVYTIAKKTTTSRKTLKNNHPLKTKELISKCQLKGAQFLHFDFQGGSSPSCPSRQLRHCLRGPPSHGYELGKMENR